MAFTNFDCSAYFVKDTEALIRTFEILPEYLKTKTRGTVNDYRDWGIQLGRRFRALKLWFVLRNFGVKDIQEKVAFHIKLARDLAEKIRVTDHFTLFEPQHQALVCFRFSPDGVEELKTLNKLNLNLLQIVNETGKAYLTQTKVRGLITLRMVTSQTYLKRENVDNAWQLIQDKAKDLI